MSKVRIKPELVSLLKLTDSSGFSMSELCADYISLDTHNQLSRRQVYQFVLRNTQRLVKAGLLETYGVSGNQRYTTTKRFTDEDFLVGRTHLNGPQRGASKTEKASARKLPEQLSCLKQELMTTLAEAKEYESLSLQHPDMRSSIQKLYNAARDRHSQLLGKIKATESLIGLCKN